MKTTAVATLYAALGAIVIWLSLVLQFIVSLQLADYNFIETIKLFLSFFTVTTNMLLGICLVSVCLFKTYKIGEFFCRSSTLTALTVYILVVAIIYNGMLRGIIHPAGWARVADELLHVVNPLIFLCFWIFLVEKSNLQYKSVYSWMIYPLVYIIFITIRGHWTGIYPYPFINVTNLGYPKAILNAFLCIIFFGLLSVVLIWMGKKKIKVHTPR